MKNNSSQILPLSASQIDYLLSPTAIRERAEKIMNLTQKGQGHFVFHPEKLDETVDYVLKVIRKNYPDLKIPFHSRWGHFRAGGINRAADLDKKLSSFSPLEKARTKLDLVITSVLLDAGAGPEWSFYENASQKKFSRSEGLGVASFYMFLSGVMSSDHKSLRADSQGLQSLSVQDLNQAFQVGPQNPLVGSEGRTQLLKNLGKALENKKIFAHGRPGNILDYLSEKHGKTIPAVSLLRAVLDGFGSIWPGRLSANLDGTQVNLGDVWSHSALGEKNSFESLVVFHKLSQWMTYSLIEPIEEAGFSVTGVEGLTGLAEYRNGGLFIDSGLISFKNSSDSQKMWAPDSELIIEWRALTVHLLDKVGAGVQKALGKSAQDFPLAKVLEGGTWWAGRFLASEKRSGGTPPINIQSDGTVF